VSAESAGTFAGVKVARLVRLAQEQDVVVRLLVRPGDFVPQGLPLLTVEGVTADEDCDWLAAVECVEKRDDHDDVALGLRQMLDVAGRALSPGINDDSTAVQCLDRLHDVLRRLGSRGYPQTAHKDAEGRLRVLTPQVSWEDHVAMVVDEMRLWGTGSLQVRARLTCAVRDLLQAVPPARRPPLEQRLPLFRDPLPVG
jgi:uncharacterized membrane protein